jgi:uncharacterized membrane protein
LTLSLANDMPVWAAAGLAALCIGLVIWFYRRHAEAVPAGYLRTLVALRVAAAALVLVFFLRPTIIFTRSEGEKSPLVVLVDASRSMSVKDAPGLPERLERVAQAVLGSDGFLENIRKRFDVSLIVFEGAAKGLAKPDDLAAIEPAGEMTDITGALARAAELTAGSARPRAVLFTDGNHNATTTSPLDNPPPFPVDCVGVGIPEGAGQALKDIEVSDAVLPERVGVGVKVRVGVRIEAHGFSNRHTRAVIKDALTGNTLGETPFVLDDVVGDQEIPVSISFDAVGRKMLAAEVPVEEDEAVTGNNRIPFSVQVTEESLKVLYVEGNLGPEGKFLRRLMLKDPDIEAVLLMRVGQDRFISQGSVGGTTLSAFPSEKGVLSMFDVVVLNNVPASSLAPEQHKHLAQLVTEDGKGLLMIGGEASFGSGGWAASPVAAALPCTVDDASPPRTGNFPLAITPAGKGSPVVEPLQNPIERNLLPGAEMVQACAAKPGAEVLLAVSPRSAALANAPVLVVAAPGRGRSAALLALPTFGWRSLSGDVHGTFWRGLLRHLAGKDILKKGEGGIMLDVSKPEFTLGETVPITARVRDPAGILSDTADVTVAWNRSGTEDKGAVKLGAVGNGEYRASFVPPAVGDYGLLATASIEGTALPSASLEFHVGRKDLEFERIGLNKEMLQALASRTGGTYVSIDSLDVLARTLVERSEVKERRTTLNPARSWITFLLFVVLVSLEWYTRRRLELA